MLETKNLTKIYKPKKGVPVKALDGVSLKFPDKGMVFLLGKSGSGKSTLLNVLGGLDRYDDGEIIIKGVSSKSFKQSHFDSYRNTYVGFIFQEYNILDEFSVGANIALAIELQGRKAKNEEINQILKEVDLEGYGNRKPNELSGGQKQRVAIARALVKNPHIIMADEPTGALDSNTGKQVFDTLKKLSENKLVIIVSHDRDFAEGYADRIIELSDGKVISDVELDNSIQSGQESEKLVYSGSQIEIPLGYELTESDRLAINEYIKGVKDGKISLEITDKKRSNKRFINTDVTKITNNLADEFKLIKSKLPLKNAFKIGASGLKHKKFRLVMTIILSCVAFTLFGLADTFASYNHIRACTDSLYDSGIDYAAITKSRLQGKGDNAYWRDYYNVSEKDINDFYENTGVKTHGVFLPFDGNLSFESNLKPNEDITETMQYDIYRPYFSGCIGISQDIIDEFGYKILAGNLPNPDTKEIMISRYFFDIFKKSGYTDGTYKQNSNGEEERTYIEINDYNDLIGKTIYFNGDTYKISGILETDFDLSRYEVLTQENNNISTKDQIIQFALYSEFNSSINYSLTGAAMISPSALEAMIASTPDIYEIVNGYFYFEGNTCHIDPSYITKLDKIDTKDIVWFGEKKTALGDKEIVVPEGILSIYDYEGLEMDEEGRYNYTKYFEKENNIRIWGDHYSNDESIDEDGYTVVGYIPYTEQNENIQRCAIVGERVFNLFSDPTGGRYEYAVGAMPKDKSDINKMVAYSYNDDDTVRYPLNSAVTFELDALNEVVEILAQVFVYIGLGFALFAALMLANFIGTSVAYKKQQIGILRAIGSRSNDVFRIFFSESFIIAMINFILSAVLAGVATAVINYFIRFEAGILVTVLNFGIRQIAILFAVSLFVAFIASFLPVRKIAAKRPIDAIRDR